MLFLKKKIEIKIWFNCYLIKEIFVLRFYLIKIFVVVVFLSKKEKCYFILYK